MTTPPAISKERLLQLIDKMEKDPSDKRRILGEAGVTSLAGVLGAAAAGTAANAVGATSIFGLTAAAKMIGISLVTATPIGWVLAASVLGMGGAIGIARLIRSGAISEGRQKELLQQYREKLKDLEAKEKAGSISDKDKTDFIVSLRELIDKDVLAPEKATQLMELVELGRIPLSQAVSIIQDLLKEKNTNKLDEAKRKSDEHVGSLEQQLQNNSDILKNLIGEIESNNEVIKQHNELLLSHDQALLSHNLAFQKAQEYVEQLQQENKDILNHIQSSKVEAKEIKRWSYIAIGVSVVAVALSVASLLK